MKNLLRKCENCVFGRKFDENRVKCLPKLPTWVSNILDVRYPDEYQGVVNNTHAETCEAFRLRETGVNE